MEGDEEWGGSGASVTGKRGVCTPALSTLSQPELSSALGGPGAQAVRDCLSVAAGQANPGQAVAARTKPGKRGVRGAQEREVRALLAAPELWLLPSHE